MAEQMEQAGIGGEQAEDQGLQQILQICQSAQDPSGYQQIAQIVQGLLTHNQGEEQEMGGEGAPAEGMAEKVMARIQKNRGE
jgi:hypothetical protein